MTPPVALTCFVIVFNTSSGMKCANPFAPSVMSPSYKNVGIPAMMTPSPYVVVMTSAIKKSINDFVYKTVLSPRIPASSAPTIDIAPIINIIVPETSPCEMFPAFLSPSLNSSQCPIPFSLSSNFKYSPIVTPTIKLNSVIITSVEAEII